MVTLQANLYHLYEVGVKQIGVKIDTLFQVACYASGKTLLKANLILARVCTVVNVYAVLGTANWLVSWTRVRRSCIALPTALVNAMDDCSLKESIAYCSP